MLRTFFAFILVFSFLFASSQTKVELQLQKRYGPTFAWGKGFVVKAGAYYGYADSNGKFLLPFTFFRFDTLFKDRACVLHMHQGYWLINEHASLFRFSASREGYTLASYKNQVLCGKNEDKQFLCDKNGNYLQAAEFSATTKLPLFLTFQAGNFPERHWGLLNQKGDTILPPIYNSINVGLSIYAGVRNDTAFVFNSKRQLLCKFGNVMDCKVLDDGFLTLVKYGHTALANVRGKVLTPFYYTSLETVQAALPGSGWIYPSKATNKKSAYFVAKRGDHEGLLDTNGVERLPFFYERIWQMHNGWFIVNKYQTELDELLDPNFNVILQADQYDLTQVDVTVMRAEIGQYTSRPRILFYDMKLRKYITPQKNYDKILEEVPPTPAEWPYPNPTEVFSRNWLSKDTVVINQAKSRLLKRKGYWGLLSHKGDTILPFIFDSVGEYGYQRFFVGKQGKLTFLDAVGNLSMPLELDRLAEVNSKDSIAYLSKDEVYSFKNWKLKKLDPSKDLVPDRYMQFFRGFYVADGKGNLPKGVYNRAGKRIAAAEAQNSFQYSYNKELMAVLDSSGKFLSVIDTVGRQLAPWIKVPKRLLFGETAALAINDTAQLDFLYRYSTDTLLFDTVKVNRKQKINLFNNTSNGKQKTYRAWNEGDFLMFEKPGYGKGLTYMQWGLLFKDAEDVALGDVAVGIKKKGLWGLYSMNGEEILKPCADSILPSGGMFFKIIINGKYGAFDAEKKQLYAAQFDSVYDLATLHSNYLVGYQGGRGRMVNAKGELLLGPFDKEPLHWYLQYQQMTYEKAGRRYYAHPSNATAFVLVPERELPAGVEIENDLENGTMLLRLNKKIGLYDISSMKWLISPKYNHITSNENVYVCQSYSPNIFAVYSSEPKELFSMNGLYHSLDVMNGSQYYLRQSHSDKELVVNLKGKVIIPDTVKFIYEFHTPDFFGYHVVTNNEKAGIVDTNGRWVTKPEFDHIDDSYLYKGFHFASTDEGWGLLNTKGKLAVPCRFHEIKEAREPKENSGRDELWSPYPSYRDTLPLFIVSVGNYPNYSYGLLDENGNELLPCNYDSLSYVLYEMQYNILPTKIVKTTAKTKSKPTVVATSTITPERVICAKKGKYWGLVDLNNKILIPFEYDWLGDESNRSFRFWKNGTQGRVDYHGNVILEER